MPLEPEQPSAHASAYASRARHVHGTYTAYALHALQVTADHVHPELHGLRYATLPARFNWRRRVHVHCMCAACALHVHCICTACALHVHCISAYTARTLHAHYSRAATPSVPQPKAETISGGGRKPYWQD